MIKTTSINPTLTPSENVEFAETVLGKVIQPQTRWSPGSLAASVIAAAVKPLIVLVSKTQLIAISLVDGIQDAAITAGEVIGAFLPSPDFVFTPDPSVASKSAPMQAEDVTVEAAVKLNGTPSTDPYLVAVMKPEVPNFTALSLLNKLESVAVEQGEEDYLIVLDQHNTACHFKGMTTSDVSAAIATMVAGTAKDIEAAFLMTPSSTGGSSSPSFGWE